MPAGSNREEKLGLPFGVKGEGNGKDNVENGDAVLEPNGPPHLSYFLNFLTILYYFHTISHILYYYLQKQKKGGYYPSSFIYNTPSFNI